MKISTFLNNNLHFKCQWMHIFYNINCKLCKFTDRTTTKNLCIKLTDVCVILSQGGKSEFCIFSKTQYHHLNCFKNH